VCDDLENESGQFAPPVEDAVTNLDGKNAAPRLAADMALYRHAHACG
jgi:hypothetical protein